MTLSQLIAILQARKWIATWIFIVTVGTALLLSLWMPKTYQATTSLVINSMGSDPVTGNILPVVAMPGYLATQIDIIESHNVALRVVDKMDVVNNDAAKQKFMQATKGEGSIRHWFADFFIENLTVRPSRESNVVDISFEAPDAQFAAAMANAFAEAFMETNLQLRIQPAKQAADFFDQQLKTLRENVERAQSNLSKFQQAHGITSGDGRLDVELARLSDLSSQLVLAQSQAYDATARKNQVNRSMVGDSPEILGNALIQGLKSQLVSAEAKLADASQRYGSNHPQYLALESDVNNLRSSIQKEITKASSSVNQTSSAYSQKEAEIRASLNAQKQKVLKLQGDKDALAVLLRELDGAQKIYENALLKSGQATMESQSIYTDIAVLNPATPPIKPVKPRTVLNVFLAIVLGAILAIVTAILVEFLNRKVRHSDDLSKQLGLRVLADLGDAYLGEAYPHTSKLRFFSLFSRPFLTPKVR